jgi:hypothetical protein
MLLVLLTGDWSVSIIMISLIGERLMPAHRKLSGITPYWIN